MKSYELLPRADTELSEAAAFYDAQTLGLGDEFLEEVHRAITLLVSSPDLGSPQRRQTRRLLVRRFPYSIVYRDESDRVLIVAIAHQSRRPGYWRRRV